MTDNLNLFAERLFAICADRPLTDDDRLRAAAELSPAGDDWTVFFPSLSRDPQDLNRLYVAAERSQEPVLLVLGRGSDGELGAEVRSFSLKDREAIQDFARRVDRRFLPRPQRSLPAIAVGNRHPAISLPAAFGAFQRILNEIGVNMASTVQLSATREMTLDEEIAQRSGDDPTAPGHTRVSIEHLYHAGLWAAIRAGWRHGYTAEADHFIVSGDSEEAVARSVERTKEAIRRAAGYTKFTTDTSRLFELPADLRHPRPWTQAQVDERFEQVLEPDEQSWLLAEFSGPFEAEDFRYAFTPDELRRLAVKFARSLKLNEQLYDFVRERKSGEPFDFEPSIDEAATLTTPKELFFCMHWLAARGRPAALVPPNLGFKKRQDYPESLSALEAYAQGMMWPELAKRAATEFRGDPVAELGARVHELAAVARWFDGTLSIHSGSGKQEKVLQKIGQETAGRVNYKISGELQLQLFDVLAEQPPSDRWRQLFERMADACTEFARQRLFGPESELAELYRARGLPYSLGDAARGRSDGNLFLVFWLGNLVGSRDRSAPDGDTRFFQEKLDELPANLVAEVQRRNADYVVWLARNLRA